MHTLLDAQSRNTPTETFLQNYTLLVLKNLLNPSKCYGCSEWNTSLYDAEYKMYAEILKYPLPWPHSETGMDVNTSSEMHELSGHRQIWYHLGAG